MTKILGKILTTGLLSMFLFIVLSQSQIFTFVEDAYALTLKQIETQQISENASLMDLNEKLQDAKKKKDSEEITKLENDIKTIKTALESLKKQQSAKQAEIKIVEQQIKTLQDIIALEKDHDKKGEYASKVFQHKLEWINLTGDEYPKSTQQSSTAKTAAPAAAPPSSTSTQSASSLCDTLKKTNLVLYNVTCKGTTASGSAPGSTTGTGLTGDDITFTNFTGTFSAPDASGYDPSLTQNKTVREYVLNIVQFVLGFLGLAAVIVVIYGGVMYVASGGVEETATKGKNAIKYAVIGIIIILGSFAMVNTLFQAGTGTDSNIPASPTSSPSGTGNTADIKLTYQRSVQSSNEISELLLAKYQQYLTLNEGIRKVGSISIRTSSPEYKQSTVDEYSRAIDDLRRQTESLSYLQAEVDQEITSGNIKVDGKMFTDPSYPLNVAAIFQKANDKDFSNFIDTEILGNKLKDVFSALGYDWNKSVSVLGIGSVDGGEITKTIENKLLGIKQNIESLKTKKDNETILKIINELSEVTKLLEDTKFVDAQIVTSTYRGSAPLFVNFDALNSLDPTGQTLPDTNYQWDLIGLDIQSIPAVGGLPACKVVSSSNNTANCKTAQGPSVSAIYNKVGRYKVALSVKSGEPSKYATGTAYIDIVVEPPSAEIKLSATPKSTGTTFKLDNQSIYQVTEMEGAKGIDFDATGSKGKGDNPIVEYRWDFGQNTVLETQKVIDDKDNVAGKTSHNFD
ncbi:hypothetical protein KKG71_03170, partial [Patescibacteria group bacterium]|nr:hypothetical protein [Patescibacteria group bacterium]